MRTILFTLMTVCTTGLMAQNVDDIYEKYVYTGKLNGNIPIEIAFQTGYNEGKWLHAGYIFYPRAGNSPILIVGRNIENAETRNNENTYCMGFEEYLPDGSMSGWFEITYTEVEGDYRFKKGWWKNPATGKVLKMTDMKEGYELPEWYPGAPATLSAPDRDEIKFRHSLTKDKDGWFQTLSVEAWARGKKVEPSFEESLMGAFRGEQEHLLQWISEPDINFDNVPDLLVYVGLTHHGRSLYKAYVWNPATRMFYSVSEFDEMQEPDIDATHKTITSTIRDVDDLYIDEYKWKNGKLRKVNTKKIALFE